MPTSIPAHAVHAARPKAARRVWLGWSWGDWALFVAAYVVIAGAVLFAAPERHQTAEQAQAVTVTAR
ncbi:hypothetical protein ABLE91_22090 [Aquabacter sp. CN5-332]|uniref:hypothetical protein n=1 Tax=Aquabacter sp. CN5-332 TaxID=3156608 RepID=UPI0032B3729A